MAAWLPRDDELGQDWRPAGTGVAALHWWAEAALKFFKKKLVKFQIVKR
jgi:hypothetical protein